MKLIKASGCFLQKCVDYFNLATIEKRKPAVVEVVEHKLVQQQTN